MSADEDMWACNCSHCLIWQAVVLLIIEVGHAEDDGGDWRPLLAAASPAVQRIVQAGIQFRQ